jgi:DNA-binding beta-propeller fold protein YncE
LDNDFLSQSRGEIQEMNIIELHLIMNHIPIIGMAFVSVELLIGLVLKNMFLQKVALYFLIAFAVIGVAAYFSGLGSEDLVKNLPGVSKAYLQLHEKVARISSFTVWFIGGLTFLGLVFLRGRDELFKYFVRGIFTMSLLSTGLFVLTGYLGGQITHAEIRTTLAERLSTRTLSIGVVGIMAVILLAMSIPLLFNRHKIFKNAVHHPDVPNANWQGNPIIMRKQDGAPAIAPAWEKPSQHASENDSFIRNTFSEPIGQQLSQTATSTTNPLSERASGGNASQHNWSSITQKTSFDGEENAMQWSKTWPQELTWKQPAIGRVQSQMTFLPSPLQEKGAPGAPGLQVPRSSIEESTRSLPIVPKPMPGAGSKPKRLKGKKWLFIALGMLSMVILLGVLGLAVLHLRKPPALPLRVIATIPLSHGPNRFDYQSLDPRTRLLFIAHSGANIVTIFDTVSMRVVADVSGITDVHGVVTAPDQGLVYAEATGANEVDVINQHTHAIVARIPVGDGADGMAYDPTDHKLFVSDEKGQNEAVIDTLTEQRITDIPLGGEVGETVYDTASHRILVEVETLNQLVTIDPIADKIVERYTLPGCRDSQSLLLDEQQSLAFVGCETNSVLLMVDLRTMRVLSTQPVGAGPDLMALDDVWHYLYVASESGEVTVFDEQGRVLRKLGEGYVAVGAHTVAVDPITHYIYLPLQNIEGRSILEIALYHP